jgi:hypothetical protein
VRPTEAPIFLTDTLMDFAAVLTLVGRNREAGPPLAEALSIYESKRDVVSARRARSLLGGIEKSASAAG